MSNFEKILAEMLDEYGRNPVRMRDIVINKYGKIIRNALVADIDPQEMWDKTDYSQVYGWYYRRGILDVKRQIKG